MYCLSISLVSRIVGQDGAQSSMDKIRLIKVCNSLVVVVGGILGCLISRVSEVCRVVGRHGARQF